jgi:hypothetical protein
MSYDEHLISMAGGDGDTVDQLAAIEARAESAEKWEFKNIADIDRETLLALVRDQQVKLDLVAALADTWWANFPSKARAVRAAITATEEGK